MSELDDATVEAIAAESYEAAGHRWADADSTIRSSWKRSVRRQAPIFARHLPDPRPTEAEVRSVFKWFTSYEMDVMREHGWLRPADHDEGER